MPSTIISYRRCKSIRFLRFLYALPLLFMFFGQTGCARSLRQDAASLAQQGGLTANQMGDYYDTLMTDTVDTYRFNTGRKYAYIFSVSRLPNDAKLQGEVAVSGTGSALVEAAKNDKFKTLSGVFNQSLYEQQYNALQKRAGMCYFHYI